MIPDNEGQHCKSEIRNRVSSSPSDQLNNAAESENSETDHIGEDHKRHKWRTVSIASPRVVKDLEANKGKQNKGAKWKVDESAPFVAGSRKKVHGLWSNIGHPKLFMDRQRAIRKDWRRRR